MAFNNLPNKSNDTAMSEEVGDDGRPGSFNTPGKVGGGIAVSDDSGATAVKLVVNLSNTYVGDIAMPSNGGSGWVKAKAVVAMCNSTGLDAHTSE